MCSGWFSSASRGYRKVFGVLVEGGSAGIRSVDENIKKARQAFFHYGSIGAFQDDLSPLSSRSIADDCVMPFCCMGVRIG